MAAGNINKLYLEGAYITKSPCRDCDRENNLPDCSNNCRMLSQVQALLSGAGSCLNKLSEHEEYSLLL
jgi:hypothetical protein